MEETINKLDLIKIKNFYFVNQNIKRMTRQTIDWQKIFSKDTSDKGLLSKIQ